MPNNLTRMYDHLREHVKDLLNPKPYSQWLAENNIMNGLPFTTKQYPFQKQILDDLHINMDVVKPSQVGLTEIQIRKALALAYRNPNKVIIFSLPSDDMRDRIADTRVKPLLQQNSIYQEGVTKDTARSKEVVQIGSSFVVFLPANQKSATSQAADVVFNDEVDLSSPQILALFNSRMQNSKWKMNQRFSTPTFAGFGVDASFKLSDQHLYMYKCPHCNEYQHPEFTPEFIHFPNFPLDLTQDFSNLEPEWIERFNLDFSQTYVKCRKCHRRAQLGVESLRQWVATYPSRVDHRGYRLNPFCSENLTPEYILKQLLIYKRTNYLRGWYNSVLGEPAKNDKNRLTKDELKGLFTDILFLGDYDPNYDYFIGYDVGSVSYITMSRVLKGEPHVEEFVLFETVKNYDLEDRVVSLSKNYNITRGLGDKYPEQTVAKNIKDRTFNKVLPVVYENTKSPKNVVEKENDYGNVEHLSIQRTWHFDTFVKDIRDGVCAFSGYGGAKEVIISHFMDMHRVDKPESLPIWEKLTGQDHYFHSAGYCHRAMCEFFELRPDEDAPNEVLYLGGLPTNFFKTKTLFGR